MARAGRSQKRENQRLRSRRDPISVDEVSAEPWPERPAAKRQERKESLKIPSKRPGTEWCVISVGGELSRPFDDSLDVGNDLSFEGGCVWEGWHVRRRLSLYGSVKPVE